MSRATLSTDKILARARQAAAAGDWITAQEHYQSVLARFPKNKRARQGLDALRPVAVGPLLAVAQEAQAEGKWAEAERTLAAAHALAPEMPEIGLALAACRLEMGRAPAALQAAEHVLGRRPNHVGAMNAKGRALREMGRGDAAEQSLLAALEHAPTDSQTLTNLGILARARGQGAAAEAYFRRALDIDPGDAGLHRNLAHAIRYTTDEPHLGQMRARLAAIGPDNPDSAPLHFALFKAYDDLDDRVAAFSHLEQGNRLTKAALAYDFKTDAMPYALSKALFKVPLHAPDGDADGPGVIFVVGLPRTGTTLTERILARAEGTQPCGELTVAQVAVGQLLRGIMARPDKALTQDDITALGTNLRRELAAYSDGRPVLIDKMPLNFRWIGYLCAALPEARFVHVARDPMAVAWSIYRHAFAGAGNGFAYDPKDIARFMVLHRDLMAHWRAVCPGRIFDLDYAALVSDPQSTTRALADAVGLAWSEDWLTPEQAPSQVLTASSEQVRKPIYRDSDVGWKRYEPHLAPLLGALRSAGIVTQEPA